MQNLLGGIRYALRQFAHSRVFSATAILTLSLGIGGTTAIFTLIHAVMLKSLPVADPEQLYRIGDGDDCCVEGGPQDRWGMFSFPLFERLKAETPEFQELTAFQAGGARVSVRREKVEAAARPLRSEYVTGNYFNTLGVGAFGGRVLTDDDDRPSSTPVTVMSHHTWQSTYGGDPSVVGAAFMIEGHPFTVVGVAPPGFFGETLRGDPPDLWIPLNQEPLINGESTLLRQPVAAWLRAIGRLKPGATTDGMSARLTGVLRLWIEHDSGYPSNWMADIVRMLPRQVLTVVPAGAGVGVMKEEYGQSLRILLVVCGLVLLIACANVANLCPHAAAADADARGRWARAGQIVVRRWCVLLAIFGGIAGLLVATGAARLLIALAFSNVRFLPIDTTPSLPILGFAFALALLTGIIFGAAPAWLATRTDPVEALRGAGRSTGDHSSLARKAPRSATLSSTRRRATMLARSPTN
jgi:predicted permease